MPNPANPPSPEAGSIREAAALITARQQPAPANQPPASPVVEGGRMRVVSETPPEGGAPEPEPETDEAPEGAPASDFDDFEEGTPEPEGDEGDVKLSVKALPPERLDEKFTVRAAGEVREVSMRELFNGYARGAEGQQQALAARQERAMIDKAAGAYLQRLKSVEEVLTKLNDAPERTTEQWQELYRTDPMGYFRERDMAREKQEQLKLVQNERAQAEQHRAQLRQQQISDVVNHEAQRLVERFPKLANPEVAAKFQGEVVGYLKSALGATDQELGQILDHRLFVLAYKAMRYDGGKKMQKAVKAKAVDAPPVQQLAPGQPRPSSSSGIGTVKKAVAALERSGSVADAAALLSARNKQRR